jgi:predicted O-methyltransferase YrrM
VAGAAPLAALEVGTFLGYSAIRIARTMPPGGRLVCVEANPANAAVARRLLQLAGLAGKVGAGLRAVAACWGRGGEGGGWCRRCARCSPTSPALLLLQVEVVEGRADEVLGVVAARLGGPAALVFVDHCKDCYLPDLRRMEALGLVVPGTLVLADNVVYPGAPGYLEVRGRGRRVARRRHRCAGGALAAMCGVSAGGCVHGHVCMAGSGLLHTALDGKPGTNACMCCRSTWTARRGDTLPSSSRQPTSTSRCGPRPPRGQAGAPPGPAAGGPLTCGCASAGAQVWNPMWEHHEDALSLSTYRGEPELAAAAES